MFQQPILRAEHLVVIGTEIGFFVDSSVAEFDFESELESLYVLGSGAIAGDPSFFPSVVTSSLLLVPRVVLPPEKPESGEVEQHWVLPV